MCQERFYNTKMESDTIFAIIGTMLMLGGIVTGIRNFPPAAMLTFLGMGLLHWGKFINLTDNALIFWGIASAITWGVAVLSGKEETSPDLQGNLYLTTGAVAGLLVGMSIDASVMILSAIVGVVIAQLAFSKTPRGKWIKFSFYNFIHYFCAAGLKTIVTISMAGIAVEGFLIR